MKKSATLNIKKYRAVLSVFLLMFLAAEESSAQVIENQNARMDVRGTSRRTARRVNRRHDYMEAPSEGYVEPVAAAPVAAAAVATAAVIYALPDGCVDRSSYFDCNGVRYRPQYQGTQVVYVQE
jgi:hypothetical protein